MYSNSQAQGCSTMSGILTIVFMFVGGWAAYGSIGAGFWSVLLWLALSLTALVGFIPIAGPFVYWNLATTSVLPALLAAAGLSTSWVTTAALWLGLICSIFWSLISVAALAGRASAASS